MIGPVASRGIPGICEPNIHYGGMLSLQSNKPDIILAVYQNKNSVFRLRDIAMLTGERNFESINKKLNSFVQKGKLQNPRKGIYVKKDYNKEELATTLGFKAGGSADANAVC